MTVFFVDYENVHASGLKGLDAKTNQDKIIIFYSNNSDTLTFSVLQAIEKTKATIEYIKIEGNSKNSLDFQLSTYLGYLVAKESDNGKTNFVIVSKDNGYGSVMEFWKRRNINIMMSTELHVELPQEELEECEVAATTMVESEHEIYPLELGDRCVEFESCNSMNIHDEHKHEEETLTTTFNMEDKILSSIPEQYEKDKDKILSIIMDNRTKQQVNNALIKEYGTRETGIIYKSIKKYIGK